MGRRPNGEVMDLFQNNPDIEWACSSVEGVPILALQTTGPALSATLLADPMREVHIQYIYDVDQLPAFVPKTFVCYTESILRPLLACEADPLLAPIMEAADKRLQWMLFFQVLVEGKEITRAFIIQGTITPEERIIPRWLVKLV